MSTAVPNTGADPFAVFGLAPRYDLDLVELERRYFDKSREVHPDRFATAPAAERVVALSRSRALNDAYQVLRKPVPRAELLLARAGVTIGGNERLAPTFLMEILELREALAEARQEGRTADVTRLQGEMRARRRAALVGIRELFAQLEGAEIDEAQPALLAQIKEQLILLRYVDRYLEECDAALDEDQES